jgi:hypothetical protein
MTILDESKPKQIDTYGWTATGFSDDYPHVIRVTPTRARIW